MSISIRAHMSQLVFPKTCVVCLSPATGEYKVEGSFTYGRRTHVVSLMVPMCEMHFDTASFKSPAERFIHWLAVFGGIAFGLVCAVLLILRWESSEGILFKLPGGGLFGIGALAIFWWIVSVSIAPLFASADSKEARTAVRITAYWPQNQIVQPEFRNESLAETVLKPN